MNKDLKECYDNEQPLLSNKIVEDKLVQHVTLKDTQRTTCPHCGFNGMTKVTKQRTMCAKIMMVLLCICLLCWIPMCMKGCSKAVHRC